jgi:hypothetical protein
LFDSPFHGSVKNGFIIIVHAEDEAAVHHHTEIVESPDRGGIISI